MTLQTYVVSDSVVILCWLHCIDSNTALLRSCVLVLQVRWNWLKSFVCLAHLIVNQCIVGLVLNGFLGPYPKEVDPYKYRVLLMSLKQRASFTKCPKSCLINTMHESTVVKLVVVPMPSTAAAAAAAAAAAVEKNPAKKVGARMVERNQTRRLLIQYNWNAWLNHPPCPRLLRFVRHQEDEWAESNHATKKAKGKSRDSNHLLPGVN